MTRTLLYPVFWLFLLLAVLQLSILSCAAQPAPAAGEPGSFQSCVAAGNPVLKTMPPQCLLPDGRLVTGPGRAPLPHIGEPLRRATPPGEGVCKDLCGNGRCEEIVCAAEGCPCPDSAKNCPSDCN